MSVTRSRAEEIAARVAALTDEQRRALAASLVASSDGGERPGGGRRPDRLVACVVVSDPAPSAEALDTHLRERLPEYMIPSRYVRLERLPRGTSGKVDRAAIDTAAGTDLKGQLIEDVVAPRDETEAKLAEIWREILGVDVVSVHDDFFEIGGDSLLSIRAISRAGRAGIAVDPESFFDDPTIAGIAARARHLAPAPEQGPVAGDAPLTPIQEWFFERIDTARDHWNQAMLLTPTVAVDRDTMVRAVETLVAHHDALRLRFVRGPEGMMQRFGPVDGTPSIRFVDLGGISESGRNAAIGREADAEHGSLDLEEGRLFRVVVFEANAAFRRVLLLAHHTVVDAVSWGILVDDLSTLLTQAASGTPFRLPAKTASVLAWSGALVDAAAAAPADPWLRPPPPEEWVRVPRDLDAGDPTNRVADSAVHSVRLDEDRTRALVEVGRGAEGGGVQQVLLAGLLLAWSRWTGAAGLQLDVEGHGRGALGDTWNVSRTVGWFTTVFPVVLALPGPDPAGALPTARDALSALPADGAGHGMLRYLHPDQGLRARLGARPRSEVLFNYVGSVDALLPPDSLLEPATEPTGRERSPDAPRAYVLELNARIERQCAIVRIEYSTALHRPESIEALGSELRAALERLIEAGAARATEFGLSNLDQAGLHRVSELLGRLDSD